MTWNEVNEFLSDARRYCINMRYSDVGGKHYLDAVDIISAARYSRIRLARN